MAVVIEELAPSEVAAKEIGPTVEESLPPKEVAPAVRVRPPAKTKASVAALPSVTVPVFASVLKFVTEVFPPFKARLKLPLAALRLSA